MDTEMLDTAMTRATGTQQIAISRRMRLGFKESTVEVHGVSHDFGDEQQPMPVLFDVDLQIDPGELTDLSDVDTERRDEMSQILELSWSVLEKAEAGAPVELDPETREQLRALGYLD